jgi:hypothetical protein
VPPLFALVLTESLHVALPPTGHRKTTKTTAGYPQTTAVSIQRERRRTHDCAGVRRFRQRQGGVERKALQNVTRSAGKPALPCTDSLRKVWRLWLGATTTLPRRGHSLDLRGTYTAEAQFPRHCHVRANLASMPFPNLPRTPERICLLPSALSGAAKTLDGEQS